MSQTPTEKYRELQNFVIGSAGEYYRGAFYYTENDWSTLYLRDDLHNANVKKHVDGLVEHMRGPSELADPDTYEKFGDRTASLEVHENAVVILIPESHNRGFILTLDRAAARDLADFIVKCKEKIES